MKVIQVDMFAVGLGASILTQFALKDESRVTVLSDGGMGRGYPPETVNKKLPETLGSFGGDKCKRIDLIVGTHYDEDHLKGLVPIIQDESIEIGEVWLPPVRKDTEEIPGKLEADVFLADLFFDDDEDSRALKDYLWRKAIRIDELQKFEKKVLELSRSGNQPNEVDLEPKFETIELDRLKEDRSKTNSIQSFLEFFESHRRAALNRINSKNIHEGAVYDSRYPTVSQVLKHDRSWRWVFDEYLEWLWSKSPRHARLILQALPSILASEASGATAAVHLQKVVTALQQRKTPIRPRSRFVDEGQPARFVWSSGERRFIRSESKADDDLRLTLLGPSEQLIAELSDKVPIGEFVYAAILQREVIPREAISASNQLSYIFTLEMLGQRILISGDAGCYKFRKGRRGKVFHTALLAALNPVHVIQIAHHGGRNYDFYHALLAASFHEQKERAFLLLSHKIEDKDRPSAAFQSFISQLRRNSDEPWLLFTSMPKESKIEEYAELIHPPVATAAKEGDVRLSYHTATFWQVDRHAIGIARSNLITEPVPVELDHAITALRPLKLKKSQLKDIATKVLSRFRKRS